MLLEGKTSQIMCYKNSLLLPIARYVTLAYRFIMAASALSELPHLSSPSLAPSSLLSVGSLVLGVASLACVLFPTPLFGFALMPLLRPAHGSSGTYRAGDSGLNGSLVHVTP